jgi:hypothetical protein
VDAQPRGRRAPSGRAGGRAGAGHGSADYLLPSLGAFGRWTRAHLLELPGLAGSGEPPHELPVAESGDAVADWLSAHARGPVVLAGHSSAPRSRRKRPCATTRRPGWYWPAPPSTPAYRALPRLLLRWRRDDPYEPPGLGESHKPEWRRAGYRRLLHLVQAHRRHDLEQPLRRLALPLLVLRGVDDQLSTERWARRLAATVPDGEYVELPDAHSFPWRHPDVWSEPVRRLATRAGRLPHPSSCPRRT